MFKKEITYKDYNGNSHTENFYFNLSRLDIHKLDKSYEKGFQEAYDAAIAANNTRAITDIFLDMIFRAYGKKSDDGMSFEKSEEISEKFMNGPAFEALLEELTNDPKAMETFFYGIIPQNVNSAVTPLA